MTTMTRRARVAAALTGAPVDRPPASAWKHNFDAERSPATFIEATLSDLDSYGWDYLKVQSRAECFPEMWGARYDWGYGLVPPQLTSTPISGPGDYADLIAQSPDDGALGEQLRALEVLRERADDDVTILWTIESPAVVARQLAPEGQKQLLHWLRADPDPILRALDAICTTFERYAARVTELGADGIFLTTTMADRDALTVAELDRFEVPFDLRILEAVGQLSCNVMHICGAGIPFALFADYPVGAHNWDVFDDNPSLVEAHRLTGRAVIGGLRPKPGFGRQQPDEITADVAAARAAMDDRWLMIGPGCSVNPDSEAGTFAAVTTAWSP